MRRPRQATGADLAALQERLRKLEEEAKRREASASPVAPPTTGSVPPVIPKPAIAKESPSLQIEENVRIDGLKYSDERQPNPAACRDACAQDARCVAFQHGRRSPMMGQCQLFSRIDARHQDASWRSGVRTDAAQPTETSLPPSIAETAHRQDRRAAHPQGEGLRRLRRRGRHGRSAQDERDQFGAGCQAICRNTPGCFAATYNDFFRGKNVACLVYRNVTDTMRAPTSTLMVRGE